MRALVVRDTGQISILSKLEETPTLVQHAIEWSYGRCEILRRSGSPLVDDLMCPGVDLHELEVAYKRRHWCWRGFHRRRGELAATKVPLIERRVRKVHAGGRMD